jgi:hypothetical protein
MSRKKNSNVKWALALAVLMICVGCAKTFKISGEWMINTPKIKKEIVIEEEVGIFFEQDHVTPICFYTRLGNIIRYRIEEMIHVGVAVSNNFIIGIIVNPYDWVRYLSGGIVINHLINQLLLCINDLWYCSRIGSSG